MLHPNSQATTDLPYVTGLVGMLQNFILMELVQINTCIYVLFLLVLSLSTVIFEIHFCCCKYQLFIIFLLLNIMPLYRYFLASFLMLMEFQVSSFGICIDI